LPNPWGSDTSELLRIGIASRAVFGKGHATLFRTLEQYPEIRSRVKLHFIGEGIDKWSYLRTKLKKLLIAHSIDTYNSNLDEWFANIDVYLAISESWESDSNSLIEAILHQKPTICSDLQNIETIYPMPLVISVGDSEGLAIILREFLNGNLLFREKSFSAKRRECLISQRPRDRMVSEWNTVLTV
jgi:glycosyltransferase involved in cell wall biosynthesis